MAGTQCRTCRVHITLIAPNHSVTSLLESHDERLFDISALPDNEDKVIPGDGDLKGTLYLATSNRSTLIRLQWEWTADWENS